METWETHDEPDNHGLGTRFFRWLAGSRLFVVCASLLVLTVLFYTEENWRGKRAWEKCKRDLTSQGGVIDWAAYIPARIPPAQNIFDAPKMKQWFGVRGQSGLPGYMNAQKLFEFAKKANNRPLAELTVVSPNALVAAANADLILQYDRPVLKLAPALETPPPLETPPQIIPLIVMDDVPLTDAIRNLARQTDLKYSLDPKLGFPPGANGEPPPQPSVSIRWQNVTPREALHALLENYNLQMVKDSKTGITRIAAKDAAGPKVVAEAALQEQLANLVRNALAPSADGAATRGAQGSQGIALVARRLDQIKTARIYVRADEMPTADEVAKFFPRNALASIVPSWIGLRAESAGSNTFQVFCPFYYSAADYLAWSDEFAPDFALIREALKRPYARLEGDYQHPFAMPIPNFVSVRLVSQMLAQRAQCYLLLGRPEEALGELTMIRDLCRMLEAKPTGKPMTLVAAMINVAVTGLYVSTVADGLRLQAWREPQLTAIQKQLEQVDLLPFVMGGFESERASACQAFAASPSELDQFFGGSRANLWQKMKEPLYWLFALAPRGWIYQNMVIYSEFIQRGIDSYDAKNGLVLPRMAIKASQDIQTLPRWAPGTFLVSIALPNYIRATQSTALNQTKANEAVAACALERYRLVHGRHPETLEMLIPDFLKKLPRDIINGQPLHYRVIDQGHFLLYSVGWNEIDDHGVVSDKGGGLDQGDWVWQQDESGI
jgi:hypothetical protein